MAISTTSYSPNGWVTIAGTSYRFKRYSGGGGTSNYITFTGETSEFTLKATNKEWDGTLEWSTDLTNWTTLTGTEAMQSVGKKLYLRGKGNTKFYTLQGVRWQLSAKAGCSGNIQTLLDWENPPTSISKNNCYLELFANCTNLTSAPELPAMTLAMNCYQSIFENCTNLIIAPEVLPATTLAGACYQNMFSGCISLTSAPKLPATTLDASCYAQMFSGCTSLIAAPELPATTLLSGCYDRMFNGCANLKVNITSGNKIFTCPLTIPIGAVQYMFDNTGGITSKRAAGGYLLDCHSSASGAVSSTVFGAYLSTAGGSSTHPVGKVVFGQGNTECAIELSGTVGGVGNSLISQGPSKTPKWVDVTSADNISTVKYSVGTSSNVTFNNGGYGTYTSQTFNGYKVLTTTSSNDTQRYTHVYTAEFTKSVNAGRWVHFDGWRSGETILSVIVTPSKNTTSGYGPRMISWFTGSDVYVAADDDNAPNGFSITVTTRDN